MFKSRLTATILLFAMLLTSVPFCDTVGAESGRDDLAILNAMGISAVESDGYITRGDFTVLTVQAAGIEHHGVSDELFSDTSGEQGEYIAAASMFGYVNGMDGDRFCPNDIISIKDATTIALRVLGFGSYAQSDMRENIISLLKLSDSIPTDGDLKCSDASVLIMNMLEAGYAVHNGQELGVSDETLMYKIHGVYRARGKINGVKGISLFGYPDIDNDEICIDNKIYINEAYAEYEYLGNVANVYIKEYEDYGAVIWLGGIKSNSIKVTSSDIEDVSGFDQNDNASPSVVYGVSDSRTKTERVDANAMVYINGVNTVSVSNSDLKPESGTVMLIDSDDNGSSDIVIIEKYDYYMVENVDYHSQIIYSEGKPEIKINSFSEDEISIIYDKKTAAFEEIKSGIVLAVMCTYKADGKIDNNKKVVIEILNKSISGQVDSIRRDNEISVNNTEYRYIDSLDEIPQIGISGEFYLGKYDEIVYWEIGKGTDGLEYGYLMRVYPSDAEEVTYVSIFDTKGIKHKLVIDDIDKVRYSGELNDNYLLEKKISRDDFHTVFSQKQLVRFAKNGERLTRIQKAIDESANSSYAGYDEERFSLDYESNNERLYAQFLSENYKISTQTIMVGVSRNGSTDDDIKIGGFDYFGTDLTGLNIKLYDSDKTFVPTVVVLTFDNLDAAAKKPSNSFVSANFAALITDRYVMVNSDGEVVTAYEAYCGGVLVNIEPEDDEVYDVKGTNWSGEGKTYFNDLEPGDIIQYGLNSKGRVDLLHVIHDHDDLTPRYTMFNSNNHISEMNTAFGKVTEFKTGSYFKLDSSSTRKYPFGRYKPNVYLYNTNSGTCTRLLEMTNLTEEDYVFVRCSRADVKDIIIYRNE